jgi:adenylate cyclase
VFPALAGLFYVYLLRAKVLVALGLAQRMLARAQSASQPKLLVQGNLSLGQASFHLGRFLVAREHLETAIAIYEGERRGQRFTHFGGVDIGVVALCFAGRTLWMLGYPDRALQRINEALSLAREISHPHSLVFAENFSCVLHQYKREFGAAKESIDHMLALSAEHGFSFWSAMGRTWRELAMAMQGGSEGLPSSRRGSARFKQRGLDAQYALCSRAEAHLARGRLDDALSALTEASSAAQEDRHYEAEVYRLNGELVLKREESNVAEAQNCFQRAIEIARKQGTKSLELRAITSLARLLASKHGRDEARAMLGEIYNWFTEGFDTADLRDA